MIKKIVLNKSQINDKFLHLYKSSYIPPKYSIYFGGSGSGKSFSVLDSLVYKCIKYRTFDIVIIRKTAATLTNTVVLPLEAIIKKRYKLEKGLDYIHNKTERRYEFASGSRIRLLGYDDPEKVKGIDGVNVIVLEELTDFTKDDLADIVDRARTMPVAKHPWKGIKILGMFNPIYETHWVRTFFFSETKNAINEIHEYCKNSIFNEDLFILKTTWRDNKWYNGKYRDAQERERERILNPRKYSVYCNGNFGILGKLVYGNNVVFCDFTRDEAMAKRVKEPGYGIDFGYNDPSAFMECIIDKNGDIWIAQELGGSELRTSQFASIIQSKYYNYAYLVAYADNQAKTIIEDMKNDHGFKKIKPCEKGAGSLLAGIEWMQDRTIFCNRRLTPMSAAELESYEYEKDKNTGLYKPIPKDANNHFMDAKRYLSNQWRKGGSGISFLK